MSGKRTSSETSLNSEKKRRKSLSLSIKLDVLKRLKDGQRQHEVCRALSLHSSTVRTIMINADKIQEHGKVATPLAALRLNTRNRSATMVEMERLLTVWIDDQTQRRMPVSLLLIQAKARSLFQHLSKDLSEEANAEVFTASRGWFNRFKHRSNLHNISVRGEAASADHIAAAAYCSQIVEIIEVGGYTSRQVFNVDETGLFWKRMPSRTYIAKEEKAMPGFKVAKDRLTLLLGGNANGDFKLKPMLVYHAENPRALKGHSKNMLPVLWRANKKAWVTRQVFEDWYTSYFCPAVREYCAKNNLDHKALLIMDNAPGHPTTLDGLNENVKVVFLPPNTTSLLQPMDQGVISTFKAYYIRRTFAQAVEATEGEDGMTLKAFWRSYDIRQAIENIARSWEEVTANTMNGVWRKLWTDCVQDFNGFDAPVASINDETVDLARRVGFEELGPDDIQELIEAHREELSDAELVEMHEHRALEEDEDDARSTEDLSPARNLTTSNLVEFLKRIDSACEFIAECDPDMQRSSAVSKVIQNAVNCYREVYHEKQKAKKQLSLDSFFKKQ